MMKLNQYIFAGFVFSLKAGLIIGLLYGVLALLTMLAFTQSVDGGALLFFTTIPAAVAFVASYWSYGSFMILRIIRKGGRAEIEAWLIPGGAALMINAFFLFGSRDPNFWVLHTTNATVSIIGVILCRKIYLKTWQKLSELTSSVSGKDLSLEA